MTALQPELDLGTIRKYVSHDLLGGREIAGDENLLLSGLLDSLSVMSLVSFIEKTSSLSIPFEDVIIENFETLDAIDEYLTKQITNG